MLEALYHIDGFGGTILNSVILFFAYLGDLYTASSIITFITVAFFVLFIYNIAQIVSGEMTVEESIKRNIIDFSNPIANNFIVKFIIISVIAGVLLSPVPLVQLTPIVESNDITKEKTLIGYTINGSKTSLNDEGKMAHIPILIAFPLSLMENYFYSIDNEAFENQRTSFLIKDTEGNYRLASATYNYNFGNPVSLEACVGGDLNNAFYGFIEKDNLTSESCYIPLSDKGVLQEEPKLAGEMFSDYFAPITKIRDILNSQSSLMENAYLKSMAFELKNSLEQTQNQLDMSKIAEYNKIIEDRIIKDIDLRISNLTFKIEKNAEKIGLLKNAYANKVVVPGLLKNILNEITLKESKKGIFLSDPALSNYNIKGGSVLSNFLTKRNAMYAANFASTIKKGVYLNEDLKLDKTDIDTISFNLGSYSGNKPTVKFNDNSGTIKMDISLDSYIASNQNLPSNAISVNDMKAGAKAEFLNNLSELIDTFSFKTGNNKHINISEIENILSSYGQKVDNIEDIKKTLEMLKIAEAKISFIYILDLVEDMINKKEEELSQFIFNYLPSFKNELEEGKLSATEDDIDNSLRTILNDMEFNSMPIFGLLIDHYSTLQFNGSTFEESSIDKGYLLLKRIEEGETFSKKILENGEYKLTDISLDTNRLTVESINKINSNMSSSNLSDELKTTLKKFYSGNALVTAVDTERKLRTYEKKFATMSVFCKQKYKDETKQADFCSAINSAVSGLDSNTMESTPFKFSIEQAIQYASSSYPIELTIEEDGYLDKSYNDLIEKATKVKLYTAGYLAALEQSDYESKDMIYNILKFGQSILSIDSGSLGLDSILIKKVTEQFSKDSSDPELKNLMKITFMNKAAANGTNTNSSEAESRADEFVSKLGDISSNIESAGDIETQLDYLTTYLAYKTAKTINGELPAYLKQNGVTADLEQRILTGTLGIESNFKPVLVNTVYDMLNFTVMEPVRKIQNVLVIKSDKTPLFTNQLLDSSLLVGDSTSFSSVEYAQAEIDYLEGGKNAALVAGGALLAKKSPVAAAVTGGIFASMDPIGATSIIVQIFVATIIFLLVLYITAIIFFAIIMHTIGLAYTIGVFGYLAVGKALLWGYEDKNIPTYFKKSYADMALIALKYMSAWIIFFVFIFSLLLIYQYLILPIQNRLEIEAIAYMLEVGVSTKANFFLYGATILVPGVLYSMIVFFSTKKIFTFYKENAYSAPAEEFKKIRGLTQDTLNKLRG